MLHRHHPNRHMSVGGARNTVETVGELDGHYDGVFGAARAETSPNITVRGTSEQSEAERTKSRAVFVAPANNNKRESFMLARLL